VENRCAFNGHMCFGESLLVPTLLVLVGHDAFNEGTPKEVKYWLDGGNNNSQSIDRGGMELSVCVP